MIRAALDFSGNVASFVLEKNGDVEVDISIVTSARESSKLSSVIVDELEKKNLKISDIEEWSVGSGPGSFTGLRLAASFVSGATLLTNKKTRCVSGAVGLVCAARTKVDEVGCIYDGRNREVIYFGLSRVNNEYVPNGNNAILNKEQAEDFFQKLSDNIELIALEQDFIAIKKIVSECVAEKIKTVEKMDIIGLLNCKSVPFDNDLTNLVYIRPATTITKKN